MICLLRLSQELWSSQDVLKLLLRPQIDYFGGALKFTAVELHWTCDLSQASAMKSGFSLFIAKDHCKILLSL